MIAIRRQTATAEEITSEGYNGFLSLFLCFCSSGIAIIASSPTPQFDFTKAGHSESF